MPETISPEVFQTLVSRTGLTLNPQQFEELRGAYPKLADLAERVRKPRDVSAEPASFFSPKV